MYLSVAKTSFSESEYHCVNLGGELFVPTQDITMEDAIKYFKESGGDAELRRHWLMPTMKYRFILFK